jgi:hypothetical protein
MSASDLDNGVSDNVGRRMELSFAYPELDHLAAWVRSDLMLPHVKKFLAGSSR